MRASRWALSALMLVVACADEPDQGLEPPADFTVSSGEGAIALGWSNEAGEPVAILRWPYPSGLEPPEDVRFDVGRTFEGEGVVLYVGGGEAFVDRTVDACGTAYEYHAYTLGAGTARSAPVVQGKALPQNVDPGAAPTRLDASAVAGGVRLSWDAPATESDFVRIQRRASTEAETLPIHTARGAGEHVDRNGLEPGATYLYDVVACNACGACSEPGASAVVDVPGDVVPTSLALSPEGSTVAFTWSAPGSGLATMRLLMREGAPVDGPEDPEALVLYEGAQAEAHVAMTTFLPDVFADETRYHFAVHACTGAGCSAGATADRAFTLREALRGGGHVVYFRHGEAGVCVDRTDLGSAAETSSPDWWKSCDRSCDVATAEQLSAAGYLEAQAAGLALRNAGVPFDRALTSEYCRAVETAARLELVPPSSIATRSELTPFVYGDDDARCEATRELLAGAALAAPDRNALIIGHGGLPAACATLDALAPGEAAVFRPTADGPLELARISPAAWSELP